MEGKRVYPNKEGGLRLEEGDYGKDGGGAWRCRPPGVKDSGSLDDHEVIEHGDGTITVAPSIVAGDVKGEAAELMDCQWHGYLEKGVWRKT